MKARLYVTAYLLVISLCCAYCAIAGLENLKICQVIFWLVMAVREALVLQDILIKENRKSDYTDVWLRKHGTNEWKGPFEGYSKARLYLDKINADPKEWTAMVWIELMDELGGGSIG